MNHKKFNLIIFLSVSLLIVGCDNISINHPSNDNMINKINLVEDR